MQVLTDAQWAKFEAAIAAVKLRGARPRKEDRRTIEAIIWRLANGAKWRSIPAELGDWHHAYLRFHRWATAGVWDKIMAHVVAQGEPKLALPASTARSPGRTRRRPEPARANRRGESATRWQRRRPETGPWTFKRRPEFQDCGRLRCGRAAGRLCSRARPGARAGSVIAAVEASAQGAGLGVGRHGV